ncbi:DNA translocase FtsK [Ureibacillus chungkukjangi]|uniref:DNA translocase FtsK n=1 Tax=Ureibacillus chungkukjangi TaxID=1202712 RepID=UPI002040B10D|nr:DNA translocase FtsK [Ureibacillus chungkukjangi]MCM3387433.1 DNA translocase FtsK [Ureibacillus chungkukjangi]
MNWFKKQINKLFDSDIDDEEFYEEVYEDEITTTNKNAEDQNQLNDENQNKKKSFKFPIIADGDMESPIESSRSANNDSHNRITSKFEESKREMKYFYQPNAISKVYDVEVSGIRDLLEKRQRIKGHSNVINRQESTKLRRIEKVKPSDSIKKDYRNTAPVQKNPVEQEDPLVPKHRFVPTQVPSPVYGFKKPSKIDELLSKKQEKTESKSIEQENDLIESKVILDTKDDVQYEQKVAAVLSEDSKRNEQSLNLEQEVSYTAPTQVPFTSFIEIEDEVEEKPNVPKEELYEKVEEFPILAEAVDEVSFSKERNTASVQPVQADQQAQMYNEAAVTVYEEEPLEIGKVPVQVYEMEQAEAQKSAELDLLEQQREEYFETEHSYEETESAQYDLETEIYSEISDTVQAEKVDNSMMLYEEPKNMSPLEVDYKKETIQFPVQSAQVQRLVSIALSDSEIEEDTELQGGQEDALMTHPEEFEDVYGVTEPIEYEVENLTGENQEQMLEEPQSKGSKIPFNVLMLKSDKEKYAAKLAQKQMLQHNDDNNKMYRQTTTTEEPHEKQEQHVSSEDLAPLPELIVEKQDYGPIVMQEEMVQEETLVIQSPETVSLQEENKETPKETAVTSKEVKAPPKIYVKPSLDYLSPPEEKTEDREWLESQAEILVESLSYFQVTAQVEAITQGPAVTQFEITVGHGTKVSKIRNLSDDLKLALAAKDIRIQAPIPGKSTIGIEIPNRISRAVQLSEVTCSDSFKDSESPLEAALGLDLTGKPVTIDLRKMPHGLIAGATGSGKSVCINSILISLLYKADPNELKLMLIDPKMVELAPFNNIPHLVSPVISDVKAATAALKWAVEEMERRYQLFAHVGVRDLPRYNKLAESKGEYGHKLPYILIVIDELADLMMMSPADVEEAICRIAQKARACGIHLIVATQRPSVDVITGLIKSNIPTRIAFAVSSQIDSRTIIDSQGAERLLGRGDMLYLGNGMSDPIRLQGTFVTDDEIEEIIEHVRAQGEPDYFFQQDELLKKTEMIEEQDELFEEVCRFVHEQGSASTSSIQRKYHIGYNRAARLIDMLESQGFVSEPRGSKPREVYITDSDLTTMFE